MLAHQPNSLASGLGGLFGFIDDDMLVACARSVEPEDALSRMSLASLESIVRELRCDDSQYQAQASAFDDAVVRACDGVDALFRLLDPDAHVQASVERAHAEIHVANEDLLKQLCIATIKDTEWWRGVIS